MIKRTVEISREPAHLSVKLGQLVITRPGNSDCPASTIPCEDVGVILVDQPQVTYSHQALAALLEQGAAVVICGRNHLPSGLLLPLTEHSQVGHRIADQIAAGKPLLKRLWQQIVVAKIRAQACALSESVERRRLIVLAREVRSGDTSNVEAQAAKVYWQGWRNGLASFRRNPSGDDAANNLLNYGYTVLRAAVGRAIVGAGLLPSLGIHHHNRGNHFALADDLMEPLRPLVDVRVREVLRSQSKATLDQPTKARLLEVLTTTVRDGDNQGPLMVALHRMAASLADCYAGAARKLILPMVFTAETDHGI